MDFNLIFIFFPLSEPWYALFVDPITEAFLLLNIPNSFEWVEKYGECNGRFESHFVELIFLPLGVSPASRPSPGTPTSPSNLSSGLKTPAPAPTPAHNPLANILSKVEITPESILSALSKTQTQSAPALQGRQTCARGSCCECLSLV